MRNWIRFRVFYWREIAIEFIYLYFWIFQSNKTEIGSTGKIFSKKSYIKFQRKLMLLSQTLNTNIDFGFSICIV